MSSTNLLEGENFPKLRFNLVYEGVTLGSYKNIYELRNYYLELFDCICCGYILFEYRVCNELYWNSACTLYFPIRSGRRILASSSVPYDSTLSFTCKSCAVDKSFTKS